LFEGLVIGVQRVAATIITTLAAGDTLFLEIGKGMGGLDTTVGTVVGP